MSPGVRDGNWADIGWLSALLGYTIWRSFYPIVYRRDDAASTARVVADVGLNVLAVVATGYWQSPFVFSLLTAVITAGFAEGFGFAFRTAITAAVAVSAPLKISSPDGVDHSLRTISQWSIELLLVAIVAGYARRLFGEAEERTELALDRMSRLAEANALLFSLHRVAQTLPASLDLDEVLDSTMVRLRDLFAFGSAVILIREDATDTWMVASSENLRLPIPELEERTFPKPLRKALQSSTALSAPDLAESDGPGFNPASRSGLYGALRARGSLVAAVALEHATPLHFGQRELELFEGLAGPVALAIDNARWFGRLRTVGADEERTRIARDLHDRIGQSLAFLAFELDRISKRAEREIVHDDLVSLRQDVRRVVSEVRETLYDLRTDVSDDQDVERTIDLYLERVRERSGLAVDFEHEATGRLPLPQERELWRIAQEAITNVERHATATNLRVRWWSDGRGALIEVVDNGKGFPVGAATRIDAYGMLGMRERADAVGARLEIESAPGRGTTVRCRLESQ